MKQTTVGEAFEIAINAEHAAESLYRGLEAKFAGYNDLVALWQRCAEDEKEHAEWLGDMRSRVAADHLAQVVDDDTVHLLQAVNEISVKRALGGIKNLEEACRVVDEIENGETNALFQFLLNNFEMDLRLRGFLRNQLIQHVARLEVELPDRFRHVSERKAVRANP